MSFTIICLIYLVMGAFAGILSGFLGLGGGIITVPCLLFLLPFLDLPPAYVMHVAIATSLAAMILTTTSSMLAHHKRGGVVWDVFQKLIPGLILGSILGSVIANWLSSNVLVIVFGVYLLLMSVRFYFQKSIPTGSHRLPNFWILNLFSILIGLVSNLLGGGGNSVSIPVLNTFNIKDRDAIGTSTAATVVTTICGSIAYLILGWGTIPAPDTLGFINVPAFLIIGLAAVFTAPYGAKLTHAIHPAKVRKIFAIILAVTGLLLII